MRHLFIEMDQDGKARRIRGWLKFARDNYPRQLVWHEGGSISFPFTDIDVLAQDEVHMIREEVRYSRVIVDKRVAEEWLKKYDNSIL